MKIRIILFLTCILLASSSVPVMRPQKEQELEKILSVLVAQNVPFAYRDLVAEASWETKVPPLLLARLFKRESGWNPRAKGHNSNGTSDMGLAQLNSRYLVWMERYNNGKPVDPWKPEVAIMVAARHLKSLHNQTGTWAGAICSYNCGITRYRSGSIPTSTLLYVEDILAPALDM